MPGLAGLSNQSWDRSRWAGLRAIFAMIFPSCALRQSIDDRNVRLTATKTAGDCLPGAKKMILIETEFFGYR
jgi:hypothetical protein